MKKSVLALITACLGCCAILFLFPAVAGASFLGLAWLNLETILCALPLFGLGAISLYVAVKHLRKKTACAVDKSCGCK